LLQLGSELQHSYNEFFYLVLGSVSKPSKLLWKFMQQNPWSDHMGLVPYQSFGSLNVLPLEKSTINKYILNSIYSSGRNLTTDCLYMCSRCSWRSQLLVATRDVVRHGIGTLQAAFWNRAFLDWSRSSNLSLVVICKGHNICCWAQHLCLATNALPSNVNMDNIPHNPTSPKIWMHNICYFSTMENTIYSMLGVKLLNDVC
jgi:hypothetical protein